MKNFIVIAGKLNNMVWELKIRGTTFKRYQEGEIMRHSIELHLDGEIPHSGLGAKEIIQLLKRDIRETKKKIKLRTS